MSDRKFNIDDDLPTDPEGILELARRLYEQHLKEGENSPLHQLKEQGIDWDEIGPMLQKAWEAHARGKEYERLAKEKEAESQEAWRKTLNNN